MASYFQTALRIFFCQKSFTMLGICLRLVLSQILIYIIYLFNPSCWEYNHFASMGLKKGMLMRKKQNKTKTTHTPKALFFLFKHNFFSIMKFVFYNLSFHVNVTCLIFVFNIFALTFEFAEIIFFCY